MTTPQKKFKTKVDTVNEEQEENVSSEKVIMMTVIDTRSQHFMQGEVSLKYDPDPIIQ